MGNVQKNKSFLSFQLDRESEKMGALIHDLSNIIAILQTIPENIEDELDEDEIDKDAIKEETKFLEKKIDEAVDFLNSLRMQVPRYGNQSEITLKQLGLNLNKRFEKKFAQSEIDVGFNWDSETILPVRESSLTICLSEMITLGLKNKESVNILSMQESDSTIIFTSGFSDSDKIQELVLLLKNYISYSDEDIDINLQDSTLSLQIKK